MTDITLMRHQRECSGFWQHNPRCFNHGSPGTGKTISSLDGYKETARGRLLVIGPLSILRSAWGSDIDTYLPNWTWAVAHGSYNKRLAAFHSDADIVLINHDGVKWIRDQLVDDPTFLDGFSHCVIDEYTAFKNRTSQRAKAVQTITDRIEYVCLLSGSVNSNKITDIWYPAYLLDHGQRLGDNFFRFQNEVCHSYPVPGARDPRARQYEEKEGAREAVALSLRDITIRHELDECEDIPEHTRRMMFVNMPDSVIRAYKQLERDSYLALQEGEVSAVHAGARAKKILQLLTGAVYGEDGEVLRVHPHRYELVVDLVAERNHSLVAFNWRHERIELARMLTARGLPFEVIDGTVSANARADIVERYQAGQYRTLLLHPQSTAHGLTLTRGTTTIWASPTYNAEHFQQLNHRIWRKGQTKRTQTICIAANGTKEEDVYEKLNDKLDRMEDILGLFAMFTREDSAA